RPGNVECGSSAARGAVGGGAVEVDVLVGCGVRVAHPRLQCCAAIAPDAAAEIEVLGFQGADAGLERGGLGFFLRELEVAGVLHVGSTVVAFELGAELGEFSVFGCGGGGGFAVEFGEGFDFVLEGGGALLGGVEGGVGGAQVGFQDGDALRQGLGVFACGLGVFGWNGHGELELVELLFVGFGGGLGGFDFLFQIFGRGIAFGDGGLQGVELVAEVTEFQLETFYGGRLAGQLRADVGSRGRLPPLALDLLLRLTQLSLHRLQLPTQSVRLLGLTPQLRHIAAAFSETLQLLLHLLQPRHAFLLLLPDRLVLLFQLLNPGRLLLVQLLHFRAGPTRAVSE
ncbi:hypothetical protein Tdes44962_MAKER04957, partial [Teratosphaeria destructans]